MYRGSKKNDLWIAGMCILVLSCCGCRAWSVPGYDQEIRSARSSQDSEPAAPGSQTPESEWNLTLVNSQHPLPQDYTVNVTHLKNGHAIDERCYPMLQAMMDACRADGLNPLICSSYRTWDYQKKLYGQKVRRLTANGYTKEEAEELAATEVALPGCSEHQLGLAVDIVDETYQLLDKAQEQTAVQRWLMEHCWEYGFILRYPNDKSEITGIIYEPWHYRYVGREAAKEIMEEGICLEEYLNR